MARPNAFYVTLDGHGQKHVHDLLLHPYLLDGRENFLIADSGSTTIALLTDLFCSSCGGPNIRATVSHGLWDAFLIREWTTTPRSSCDDDDEDKASLRLWDMVRAMLVAMEWAACSPRAKIHQYRPVFSYTAVTCRSLCQAKESLQTLGVIQCSDDYQRYLTRAYGEFGDIPVVGDLWFSLDDLDTLLDFKSSEILAQSPSSTPSSPSSTAQDVFHEHDLNQRFANVGATRTLLQDVKSATNSHIEYLQQSLSTLASDNNNHSTRKRKTALRIVHSSQLAMMIYKLTTCIATMSLQQQLTQDDSSTTTNNNNGACSRSSTVVDQATMLKAVERSRMVVSTVDTFLHTKIDRVVKSVREYVKGKAVKAVLMNHWQELEPR
jgi:hypothetical protein